MAFDPDLAKTISLEGRVAVITGAASGFGAEASRLFARAGARVVLADLNEAGAAATAAQVREAGGEASVMRTDTANRDEVDALAEAAVKEFGSVDIWLNIAGVSVWKPIFETSAEDAERTLAVNTMGVYWGCAAAARVMQAQGKGGAIVNISSAGGTSPVAGLASYCMSKAAVNMLTKVCALEFGVFGVRVNAVAPGWIETAMARKPFVDASGATDEAGLEAMRAAQAAASPLGINGSTQDIALALLYLASDASRFVSGQVLTVNGGVSM
ncbi:MAG: SDR family NAD(P)-dependent oxidoreductase [Novosphingobium sp.]